MPHDPDDHGSVPLEEVEAWLRAMRCTPTAPKPITSSLWEWIVPDGRTIVVPTVDMTPAAWDAYKARIWDVIDHTDPDA